MIEVKLTDDSGELAYIKIEKEADYGDGTADYAVSFAVDRAQSQVGLHRRAVLNFPRLEYNALALLLQALNTLDASELELERGCSPADLARRFSRAWRTLPR